ncbi:MAG: hypothetical protein ACYDH6_21080 [Acidimicrobiales bacterium]
MSTRRRRPGSMFATTAAVLVIASVLLVVALIELASNGNVKSQLGAATFLAGRARDYAPQVAAQGPVLFSDLVGRDRPIYLQHLGPDPKLGWVAIQATVPGTPSKCVLVWRQADHLFADPCGPATYPADGGGLVRYPATVLPSDRIDIDLRHALPASTTITTGTAPPA